MNRFNSKNITSCTCNAMHQVATQPPWPWLPWLAYVPNGGIMHSSDELEGLTHCKHRHRMWWLRGRGRGARVPPPQRLYKGGSAPAKILPLNCCNYTS